MLVSDCIIVLLVLLLPSHGFDSPDQTNSEFQEYLATREQRENDAMQYLADWRVMRRMRSGSAPAALATQALEQII